jgi:hypothetical protein
LLIQVYDLQHPENLGKHVMWMASFKAEKSSIDRKNGKLARNLLFLARNLEIV